MELCNTKGEEALSSAASPLPGASLQLSKSFTQVRLRLISSAAAGEQTLWTAVHHEEAEMRYWM